MWGWAASVGVGQAKRVEVDAELGEAGQAKTTVFGDGLGAPTSIWLVSACPWRVDCNMRD